MMKNFTFLNRILLTALAAMFLMTSSFGQTVVVGWEMNGLSAYGPSPFTPTSIDGNVSSVGWTRGPGVGTSGTAAGNAWGGVAWNTASYAAAVAAGKFVTFTVSPNTGYQFSLSQIEPYNIRRSGTGPTTGRWQYALDGTTFVDITGDITWGSNTSASGNLQLAIDLTAITELQDIPADVTVTFRIVNWDASAAGGTWYLNNFQTGNDMILLASAIELPIDLLSFKATPKDGKVVLDWTYENAIDFERFVVEHSAGDRGWSEVASVELLDNNPVSARSNALQAVHNEPVNGANYYRLKMIDLDGTYKYSKVEAVNMMKTGTVRVVNNMVEQRVHLMNEGGHERIVIQFTDMNGRRVAEKVLDGMGGTNDVYVDVEGVEGMFIMTIQAGGAIDAYKMMRRN